MVSVSVSTHFSTVQRERFVIRPDQQSHLLRVSRFVFFDGRFPELGCARRHRSILYDDRWWRRLTTHDDHRSLFKVHEHRECDDRRDQKTRQGLLFHFYVRRSFVGMSRPNLNCTTIHKKKSTTLIK